MSTETVPYTKPLWRFVILCILTFSLYELYWFYRNWQYLKEKKKINIHPFWRTLFAVIFSYSFFKNVFEISKKMGLKGFHHPTILAISYFLIEILYRLPDPYWLISLLSFLPLIPAVNALNYIGEKGKSYNESFSDAENFVIIVGAIFWVLLIIGFMLPE